MTIPATILMSLLSSGVRAIKGAVAPPSPAASDGATDFDSLLGKARAGEVSTGLPVTVARGVDIELTDAQLERLALAADRAESAGSTRALAFIDGRALEIDVATRTVTREHTIEQARVITGIDSVIDLGMTTPPASAEGGEHEPGEPSSSLNLAPRPVESTPLPPPRDVARWSPSLLSTLAER